MNFKDIIGQEKIVKNLQSAIKNNSIAHSYLFEGPESIGKSKLGKAFAKTLLCKENGVEPCDKCSSCIKIDSGNHPDLFIVGPSGNSFKKEQVDEIQRNMRILPYEGNRKVFILEDIQKMTQEAENGFLKTLEEPPEYAIIIMTVTNSYSILPTIVSRCQIIKFNPVQNNKIEQVLVNKYNKSSEEARFIASFSNGIVGKAIKLAESEDFKNLREEVISVINDTLNSDKFRVFSISQFFEQNKEYIDDILDMMLIWFRDLLIVKEMADAKFVINKDKTDILNDQSLKLSRSKLHDIIEEVKKTKNNIASNVNYQLAIEVMLLKIQEV
ncbi:DNA polymerase III subunit delta' [Caldisalinibacter kiritimatiensis]|uniref:DNA polymerase III subunit delta' n=1 Tax=Caldisalinibacter kiritimatiensis TaxID=1304284 RepID=R1CWR4_9FIRM|nr:DNA polymerase III subunit delta' [Caldisalinibacter kiritimatiensis]EOD01059.1 DNA polymerase III delta prime subunit [Caldisalinibacter kiritimatiensis]